MRNEKNILRVLMLSTVLFRSCGSSSDDFTLLSRSSQEITEDYLDDL